ncbi:flagellar hook-length control protein FliK [Steroidobacter cummioxidans]|uniref:flagellar hook-length control protein FliK n=1 Tax=Steroidobacter cummioxidans TaxID=1803913 RepID=UPI000E31C08F|nr:flagellar hook-length control protein FliK [Steroidobacter cummioxidans]
MTAIAFGNALIGADASAAGAQPGLPLLSVAQAPGLPTPALPVTPIRFGEQLRQSLGADALATLNVTPRLLEQPKFDAESGEPSEDLSEDATDVQPAFPGLITFTQPVTVPLEYAQRSTGFSQQPHLQNQQPIAPVSLPTQSAGPREQTLLSVLAAVPETSALGALTINAPALSMAAKGNAGAVFTDNQSPLPVTQLASLTNAGLAQALVEGFNQQPGVLAPVSTQPAQPLNAPRSALEAALGDRLHLQITQRSEHAVIRLDPPSMGTIEIVIQREGGNIQVHLRATNAEVARQLHGIGDSLRQDLINRQNGDVSVHVSDSSREHSASQQGQRQSQAQRETPGRALSEGNEESTKSFTLAVDEERGA